MLKNFKKNYKMFLKILKLNFSKKKYHGNFGKNYNCTFTFKKTQNAQIIIIFKKILIFQ